ncbi:proline hydroxylase [Novosphingobium pokkalii]|nr:proline hydroxylase [Novosphingobium pokkalii]
MNLAQQTERDICATLTEALEKGMANPFSPIASADARQAAATAFAATGHVRLAPVLPGETADALHRWLHDEADFARVLNQGDKVWDLDAKARAALDPERQLALVDAVHAQAREGFQFLFDSLRVSENPAERAARDTPVDRLISAFNTPPWLDLFRTLTGEPAIRLVDGQATRYLPGHFLTGHDDNVAGKNRVAAYVLNLTPRWRVEWGGLLMFHDDAGDVTRALAPRHNALHLFRVPQPHSVSLVAPFAGEPRLAITGWLRR